jgi:hypothetical protein
MAVLYKEKKNEGKEDEINVNASKPTRTTEQGSVDSVGAILKRYEPIRPRSLAKPDALAKRDHLAETLADQLNDRKSLGCYRMLGVFAYMQKPPMSVLTPKWNFLDLTINKVDRYTTQQPQQKAQKSHAQQIWQIEQFSKLCTL